MTLNFLKEIFWDHFHYVRLCIFWAFIGLYRRYNHTGRNPGAFVRRPTNWLFLLASMLTTLSAVMMIPLYLAAIYGHSLICLFVLILYGASGGVFMVFMAESSPEEITREFLD